VLRLVAVLTALLAAACGTKEAPPEPARDEDVRARHETDRKRVEAEAARAKVISDARRYEVAERDTDPEIQAVRDKVNAAVQAVVAATSDVDRDKAMLELEKVDEEHTALSRKKAKAALDRAVEERSKRPVPRGSLDCAANPLAKGCM